MSIHSFLGSTFSNFQTRIANGGGDRSLNSREAGRLDRRANNLQAAYSRDAGDGFGLTWREERRLARRAGRVDRAIFRQRHDAQRA